MADPEEEQWMWVGFVKESRLLLRIVVGPRMQESADELIKGIDRCLDKNNELPLFVSDGNNQYRVALFNLYNETVTPLKTGKRGRPKIPYKIPRTDLRYAQVIKERKGGKLVKVHKQMIFYMSFFDFVRPHSGLKLKINPDDKDITNRKYIQRTSMIAAGKTDHIWLMEELLTFPNFETSVN